MCCCCPPCPQVFPGVPAGTPPALTSFVPANYSWVGVATGVAGAAVAPQLSTLDVSACVPTLLPYCLEQVKLLAA